MTEEELAVAPAPDSAEEVARRLEASKEGLAGPLEDAAETISDASRSVKQTFQSAVHKLLDLLPFTHGEQHPPPPPRQNAAGDAQPSADAHSGVRELVHSVKSAAVGAEKAVENVLKSTLGPTEHAMESALAAAAPEVKHLFRRVGDKLHSSAVVIETAFERLGGAQAQPAARGLSEPQLDQATEELRQSLDESIGDEADRQVNRRTLINDLLRAVNGESEAVETGDEIEASVVGPAPYAVVYPASTDEVSAVLAVCHRYAVAVVPQGLGRSLEGNAVPLQPGIVLDLRRMSAVTAVNESNFSCDVEAGCTLQTLNGRLASHGLFFPVDAGVDATLGGMAGTNASGTALLYGTMRDNVLAVTAVLADGAVLRAGSAAPKGCPGYDLVRLLVGSEGTLAVITELTLRLRRIPPCTSSGVLCMSDITSALAAAVDLAKLVPLLPLARCELVDEDCTHAVRHLLRQRQRPLERPDLDSVGELEPLGCLLFVELHAADAAGVASGRAQLEATARAHGLHSAEWTSDPDRKLRLWRARDLLWLACAAARPESQTFATDVAVPLSALASCVLATKEDALSEGFLAPITGHVADGTFHALICVDLRDAEEVARARAFHQRLLARALASGGSCAGEYGIGMGKAHLFRDQLGPVGSQIHQSIKQVWDPRGELNPNKLISEIYQ